MKKRLGWLWYDSSQVRTFGRIWQSDLATWCHRWRTVGWNTCKISCIRERKSFCRKTSQLNVFRHGLNWAWSAAMAQLFRIAQKLSIIFLILMEKNKSSLKESSFGKWCTHLCLIKLRVTSCRLKSKEEINLIYKIKEPKLVLAMTS